MRSRYDLARDSDTKADDGTYYKDICSIPLDKFRYTSAAKSHDVTGIETKRVDILIYNEYGVPEFDDIVLWLNGQGDPTDLSVGDELLVPTKADMESFYYKYRI